MIRCGETECRNRTRDGGCRADAEVKGVIKICPPDGTRLLYCDKFDPKDDIWEFRETIRRALEYDGK